MRKNELGHHANVYEHLSPAERAFADAFEARLEALAKGMGLEPPEFDLSFDDINETTAAVIRLGIPEVADSKPDRDLDAEARHIFAHWLCNAEGGRDGDVVADAIAELIKKAGI